jgi:hypothetical protein
MPRGDAARPEFRTTCGRPPGAVSAVSRAGGLLMAQHQTAGFGGQQQEEEERERHPRP